MGKKLKCILDVHVRFNDRNPRYLQAAELLASVPTKYKTAFLTLAIESYLASRYPLGVNMDELMSIQKETDRSYLPKKPIGENLQSDYARQPFSAAPPARGKPEPPEEEDIINAIDKAMAAFGVK